MQKKIQVIYVPGTFGNCLRWLFYRFIKDSPFKDIDSPWDENRRVHGFFDHSGHDGRFRRGHQINESADAPDSDADKVVISFEPKDLLFAERCGFYRNPGNENEKNRYLMKISKNIKKLNRNNIYNIIMLVTDDKNC